MKFGSFELDPQAYELKNAGQAVKLERIPMELLLLLTARQGKLITREEIAGYIWGKDHFLDSESAINTAIRKLRIALGEDPEHPRFIETVPRKGYRFLGSVDIADDSVEAFTTQRPLSGFHSLAELPPRRQTVGREKERSELRAAFESVATTGRGMMVCVSGEPGIGKTTLIQDLLAEFHAGTACHIGLGRCSERLAGTEAYLPVLEALESLLHAGTETGIGRTMRLIAPTWYVQVARLALDDSSAARLLASAEAASQERMKRELAAFLREISRLRPLVLFFDDLHWSDISTVDLISYLASKFDSLRLLTLVTYRQSELLLTKHPFLPVRLELQARGHCHELPLDFLSEQDVKNYLALEFPANFFPAAFPALIHSKTEGNPLFFVDLVRYLFDRKAITREGERWALVQGVADLEHELPESVRSMIQRRIDHLEERDRHLLIAAGVQGYEFDSAIVAEVVAVDPAETEERLEALDRVHGLVRFISEYEFPDKILSLRYRFVHVLYQNALCGSLRATRRASLSAATANALVRHYPDRKSLVASKLAFLFESARDAGRASEFFLLGAQNAAGLFANREASVLAQRGMELLKTLPPSPEHTCREIDFQVVLGFSLGLWKGHAAAEAGRAMAQARDLCLQTGEKHRLVPLFWGLSTYYRAAGELDLSRQMAEQLLSLASGTDDPIQLLGANTALGIAVHHLGEPGLGLDYFEKAISLDAPERRPSAILLYRMDPGLYARSEISRALLLLGYPDQARCRIQEAVAQARGTAHPRSLAFALTFSAFVHQFLRHPRETLQFANECIALCDEYGIAHERALVMPVRGWAMAEQGEIEAGIAEAIRGLAVQCDMRSYVARPQFLCYLIEALGGADRPREALAAADEALAVSEKTGDHYYDAEVYRLKGEMLLRENAENTTKAQACFHHSLGIARRQGAKSLELRAAMSLGRLWLRQAKEPKACQMLAEIYAWFVEGFDTADLKDAKLLLEQFSNERLGITTRQGAPSKS
jgi:DNA-binding winged helix-turn-helix (wHTH) protein/predicted ATPase